MTPELPLPIYLDYAATTPVDHRVFEKMAPYFCEKFGNAASNHWYGDEAREAVECARKAVATLVGGFPQNIIFTSGATESINTAIKGVAYGLQNRGRHIITTAIEHNAVLESCRYLEQQGFEITRLPVDHAGEVDPVSVEAALRPTTILIAVMHANNETGVVQPLEKIGAIARRFNILFFTDATQTAGKLPVDFTKTNVDIAAFSGHKMYGPKGCGALYIAHRDSKKLLVPALHGGGQENNLRSGTHNVPAIVGFGEACSIAIREMERNHKHAGTLQRYFETGVSMRIHPVMINGGAASRRLPFISNITIDGVIAGEVLQNMKTIAASTASACSGGGALRSHVLAAMGQSRAGLRGAFRLSWGKSTTIDEIEYAITRLAEAVAHQ